MRRPAHTQAGQVLWAALLLAAAPLPPQFPPPSADHLERAALARGGRQALEALRAVHLEGSVDFGGAGETVAVPFRAFLRFPDRARFEFGTDRARRILLLRGETVFERSETSSSFAEVEGSAAESIRRNALVHVVAARFPALPEPLRVAAQPDPEGRWRIEPAPGIVAVRFSAGEALPSAVELAGPPAETFRLLDWSAPEGRLRSARTIRAEVEGVVAWTERIERWVPNPMLLDSLFEPPRGATSSPPPVLDAIRLVDAPAVPLLEVVPARGWDAIPEAVSALRAQTSAKAIVLLLVSQGGDGLEVAAVANSPGAGGKRVLPAGEIAEVFVRGSLAEARGALDRLREFLRRENRLPGSPATLSRDPDEWGLPDGPEGVFRVTLPATRPR